VPAVSSKCGAEQCLQAVTCRGPVSQLSQPPVLAGDLVLLVACRPCCAGDRTALERSLTASTEDAEACRAVCAQVQAANEGGCETLRMQVSGDAQTLGCWDVGVKGQAHLHPFQHAHPSIVVRSHWQHPIFPKITCPGIVALQSCSAACRAVRMPCSTASRSATAYSSVARRRKRRTPRFAHAPPNVYVPCKLTASRTALAWRPQDCALSTNDPLIPWAQTVAGICIATCMHC